MHKLTTLRSVLNQICENHFLLLTHFLATSTNPIFRHHNDKTHILFFLILKPNSTCSEICVINVYTTESYK